MTQPPTPDAIRAAIAELCRRAIVYGQDTTIATLKELQAAERGVDNALTQLGAVPAAGMVTISRETARRAHSALVYFRVAKDEMQDDEEQRAERELASALAGGADDGVPDPNTPEGGNTPFDPQEWVDEETGVRFTDDDDVPTKAALRAAIELTNGSSYWCGVTTMGNQGFVDKFDEAKAALDALIDRLPIANGEDT